MQIDEQNVDRYFNLMSQIRELRRNKQYLEMLEKCKSSWPLIESVIGWRKRNKKGTTRISIPAIEIACPFLAVYGSVSILSSLRNLVYDLPELSYYRSKVDEAFIMCWIANRICWKAKTLNGVLQKDLDLYLNFKNAKTVSRVIQYLEKIRRIERERVDSTYRITTSTA